MKKIMVVFLTLMIAANVSADTINNPLLIYLPDKSGSTVAFNQNIEYFTENMDCSTYSPDLSLMLMGLSWSAYDKAKKNAPISELSICKSFVSLGLNDITPLEYYENPNDADYGSDNCAYTLGHKALKDGRNLILVVIRGSYGGIEKFTSDWQSNFNFLVTENKNHGGFEKAAKKVKSGIESYTSELGLENNVYVVTGHSRGAAVSNLLSSFLTDEGKGDVYSYNFACPDTTTVKENVKKYSNIFNICNTKDIITTVPRLATYTRDEKVKSINKSALDGLMTYLKIYSGLDSDSMLREAAQFSWYKCGTTLWYTEDSKDDGTEISGNLTALLQIDLYTHAQTEYMQKLKSLPQKSEFEQEGDVRIVVSGNVLTFDSPAQIINGRTLVPMRKIFEALNAEVSWDEDTQTANAVKNEISVSISVNSSVMYKNGEPITLDVPSLLINDRTMIPLRAVSEALNCVVEWDESTQTVTVI